MRAAIYARLSHKDRARAGTGLESTAIQVENGTRAAQEQGWTVVSQLVCVDDGISGAEILRRPGLQRLLAAAESGAIDVVVVRDLDRLTRDALRQAVILAAFTDARVQVFAYADGAFVPVTGPGYAITAMRGVVGEMERAQTSRRTREKAEHMVEMGAAVTRAPFGYCIVRDGGIPRYQLVPEQVETILEVGRRYVECGGLFRRTAILLTAAGLRSPQGCAWSPEAVRTVLQHPLYRGVLRFGAQKKVYERGTGKRVRAAADRVLTAPHPELCVWPDALLAEIDALLARPRRRWSGAATPRYLCSGFVRCGICGHALVARPGPQHSYYRCSLHSNGGAGACVGVGMRPIDVVDEAVRSAIAPLLDGDVAHRALELLEERLVAEADGSGQDAERERLRRELAEAERGVAHLTAAITLGKPPAPLLDKLRAEDARAAELRARLDRLSRRAPVRLDVRRALADARARLGNQARLLRAGGVAARPVLDAVLGAERIRAVPVRVGGERRWQLSATIGGGWLLCNDVRDASSSA